MELFQSKPNGTNPVRLVVILVCLGLVLVVAVIFFMYSFSQPKVITSIPSTSPGAPKLIAETVIDGLDHPWDIAFLPDGKPLFTEREGRIKTYADGQQMQLLKVDDVVAASEGGLLGLAVDPQFTSNRFIYTCYTTRSDTRVVRWKINNEATTLTDKQPIVTGMPVNPSGRHSGCRITFGPDDALWIGTGDTARAVAQDPKNLGGKILRVTREGNGAPGNLDTPFDPRIFSYGHRNTQGIAFLAKPTGDLIGYSAEHGSTLDDEINPLVKGNFGWDPDAAYTERGVPMTDKQKYPDAIGAIWSSGTPTQAPSGLTQIRGEQWQSWNGSFALAALKAKHLKILTINGNKVTNEEKVIEDRGRLRDVEQAPDGSLYITTDNGNNKDEIIRLTPSAS